MHNIGQISIFPYTFTPIDWLPCDGRILKVSEYEALFSLLGNRFGGDGRTTFALPDLKAAADTLDGNLHYAIVVDGAFPSKP